MRRSGVNVNCAVAAELRPRLRNRHPNQCRNEVQPPCRRVYSAPRKQSSANPARPKRSPGHLHHLLRPFPMRHANGRGASAANWKMRTGEPTQGSPVQPNPTCQPKTLRIDQAVEHRGIRRIDRNGNGVGLRLLFTTLPHLSAKSKKPQFTPGSDALRQGVRRIDFRFTGCQCSVSGLSARVNSPAGNSTVPSVTTRYF